jgi:serine protease inhibitor
MTRLILIIILLLSLITGVSAVERKGSVVLEHDQSAVASGNNQFAIDLYRALRSRPGNVTISPASISNALALTYEGARGTTAEEMARTLHFPSDRAQMRQAFHDLLARINGDGTSRPYQLNAANSLWGQSGDSFLPDYLRVASETYGADLKSVDFRGDAAPACQTINSWVDSKTNHLITQLLSPNDVNSNTSLVLVNTLYFKGTWQEPFLKAATSPADFHIAPGKTVSAPLMRQTHSHGYVETADEQVLELPYVGGDYAMLVVLPRSVDGLGRLEESLTPARIDTWVGNLAKRKVAVEIPKLKLTSKVELSKDLAGLGMPTAFTASADFSGIDGKRDLFISAVVHQAVVNVDEEGTEAAAATGVTMRSLAVKQEPIASFRADHPFLYLIRDIKTGNILFLGKVADPTR